MLLGNFQCALSHGKVSLSLTNTTNFELQDWRDLISNVTVRPTHFLEVVPLAPTWHGLHDAYKMGPEGVFWGPQVQPFLWRLPLLPDIAQRIMTLDNRNGDQTMGEFELASAVAQVAIMAPSMSLLSAAHKRCGNTMARGWTNYHSNSFLVTASALLRARAFTLCEHRVTTTIVYQPRDCNLLANDSSWRLGLSDDQLIKNFNSTYP